jgi:hypothetical protein
LNRCTDKEAIGYGRERGVRVALGIMLAVVVAAGALSYVWLTREVASEVQVLNPEGGAGTALVVYHPGKTDFHEKVTSGFADGLVANGWSVDVTTASWRAPTGLAGYDLLVVGGPTYWFLPARPIRRYLARLGDLDGMRTVTIITAAGAGERASSVMQRQVREANGELIDALVLNRMRPNDDDNYVDTNQNRALAVEMATHAAKQIAPPAK